MASDSNFRIHLLMLMVAIIWGLSWAIGKMLTLELPPLTGAWLRYILTMIIFYLWFAMRAISGEKVRWLPTDKGTMKSLIIIGFHWSIVLPIFLYAWHVLYCSRRCLFNNYI